jgi:hypothetical protein
MSDYRISPVDVPGEAPADGVWVNWRGEWLGDVVDWSGKMDVPASERCVRVLPRATEDADWMPAPEGWRDRVMEQLR